MASCKCVQLRSVSQHIRETCGLPTNKKIPTTLCEDNTVCIAQLKECYIKGDMTKHISPKFFNTHDLQEKSDISIQQICSNDSHLDLFTKAFPTTTFEKLVQKIGM